MVKLLYTARIRRLRLDIFKSLAKQDWEVFVVLVSVDSLSKDYPWYTPYQFAKDWPLPPETFPLDSHHIRTKFPPKRLNMCIENNFVRHLNKRERIPIKKAHHKVGFSF